MQNVLDAACDHDVSCARQGGTGVRGTSSHGGDPGLRTESLGQSIPAFCPIGPLLAPREEIRDPDDVQLAAGLKGTRDAVGQPQRPGLRCCQVDRLLRTGIVSSRATSSPRVALGCRLRAQLQGFFMRAGDRSGSAPPASAFWPIRSPSYTKKSYTKNRYQTRHPAADLPLGHSGCGCVMVTTARISQNCTNNAATAGKIARDWSSRQFGGNTAKHLSDWKMKLST